jgi:hypothetical protein
MHNNWNIEGVESSMCGLDAGLMCILYMLMADTVFFKFLFTFVFTWIGIIARSFLTYHPPPPPPPPPKKKKKKERRNYKSQLEGHK